MPPSVSDKLFNTENSFHFILVAEIEIWWSALWEQKRASKSQIQIPTVPCRNYRHTFSPSLIWTIALIKNIEILNVDS